MSNENVALMQRWFDEVWNQRRRETISELFAEGAIAHWVDETGRDLTGPQEFLPYYDRLCAAFPDLRMTVDECFEAGDKVIVRWSARMRHTGDLLEIRATGKPVAVNGMTMARIAHGKVVEGWDCWDKLGMLMQIDAVELKMERAAAEGSG
jgi:steroid delta-isomerase-like uncharacterized protein